jgi:hypothetical protein
MMRNSLRHILQQVDRGRDGEETLHHYMQGLREAIHNRGLVPQMDRPTAFLKAITAISAVLKIVNGQRQLTGEPGHGPGHWCRDYVHALRLSFDETLPAEAVLPTLVAGTLHDIGTAFVDRYADKTRAVRHAEVGALIVRAAALESEALTPVEADLAAYAIAAHTHYLKPSEVACADGETRTVTPYTDMDGYKPIYAVWAPRWVDRLDCSGPCFVGRHYLTLARDHEDFGGTTGFYKVTLAKHLRPLLRSADEIKAQGDGMTMLEHFRMFAQSQSDDSPYGRHDVGIMRTLRQAYRASLENIIAQTAHPTDAEAPILKAWELFLGTNVEPSEQGWMTAHNLGLRAFADDPEAKHAWSSGFRAVMFEYLAWADRTLAFLKRLPAEYLRLPGISDDIRNVVRPHPSWVKLLTG